MNEVYADAYHITEIRNNLKLPKNFTIFFLILYRGDNWHANTQIKMSVCKIAELINMIFTKRQRAFLGNRCKQQNHSFWRNSRREHFPSASSCIDYVNDVDGPKHVIPTIC